ncbi:MAG: hypothetical protein H7Y60_12415 [Rhodospirillaceae bacterium]|nr:hypothetical protein [Rhodospirillales bacterium]
MQSHYFARLTFAVLSTGLMCSACSESSPSESTIKKELSRKYTPNEACKIFSLSGVEKINGFHQTDGSYVVSVKFKVFYSPTNKMVRGFAWSAENEKNLKHLQKDSENKIRDIRFNGTGDIESQVDAVVSNYRTKESEYEKEYKSRVSSAIEEACPGIGRLEDHLFLFGIYSKDRPLGEEAISEMSGNIHMIHSDNGWVLTN